MTDLITELLKILQSIFQSIFRFLFGNSEKKAKHEWRLNSLEIDKSLLERSHEQELKSLDDDIGVLYDRRRAEGMTKSEVMHEWDKRRGDIRERQLTEISHIENDIKYHETMVLKHSGLFIRTRGNSIPGATLSLHWLRDLIKLS